MGNMSDANEIGLVRPSSAALAQQLTPRQLDVLELLCEGLPNKMIGRRLNIASGTVKVHIAHILRALKVSSRLQAVLAARSLGFGDRAGGAPAIERGASAAPCNPVVLRLALDDDDSYAPAAESDWPLAAAAG